jgi:hypothetical protein
MYYVLYAIGDVVWGGTEWKEDKITFYDPPNKGSLYDFEDVSFTPYDPPKGGYISGYKILTTNELLRK